MGGSVSVRTAPLRSRPSARASPVSRMIATTSPVSGSTVSRDVCRQEGVALLELARDAQRLFAKQELREKRRLLNFLLSNCSWEDGKVVATFHQPFDMLAERIVETRNGNAPEDVSERVFEKWLPFVTRYRTMSLAPSAGFRRILEDVRELGLAA